MIRNTCDTGHYFTEAKLGPRCCVLCKEITFSSSYGHIPEIELERKCCMVSCVLGFNVASCHGLTPATLMKMTKSTS